MSNEIIPPKHGHGDSRENPYQCIKCGKKINAWDYLFHNTWTLRIRKGEPIRFFMLFYCGKCWKTVNRKFLEFRKSK